MNIINILALILFGIGIVLILDTDKFNNKKVRLNVKKPISNEGMSNAERDKKEEELAQDQEQHYKARNMKSVTQGASKESNTLKLVPASKAGGKQRLVAEVSVSDMSASQIAKEVEKCRVIDETGNCDNLIGTHCGYCLSSNKILFGDASGPKVDVCKKNSPGKQDWWIPPGQNAGPLCTEMKERAICRTMKDCGDRGGNKNICAWCPVKGAGMVYKVNPQTGGLEPKYADKDKCDWPYKGIDTVWRNPVWHGWDGKKVDTRTYKTVYYPSSIIHRPRESHGSYITSYGGSLRTGFSKVKAQGGRYAVWNSSKSMYDYHRAGSSNRRNTNAIYRVDNWTSVRELQGGAVTPVKMALGGGDCDADSDCPTGMKCGQRGSQALKGLNIQSGTKHSKDYCYDPSLAGILGPLVPQEECKTFNQRFPCMTPNLLTGPHTTACYQDLWSKSGCDGNVSQRASSTPEGRSAMKTWNSISYINVLNNMKGMFNKMGSNNYKVAKQANMVCKGRKVDPCEARFYSKFRKKARPNDCIDKLYKDSGCSKKGKLYRTNLRKWKGTKGGGIPNGWEEGQNYNWTPQQYLARLSAIRQKASLNKRRMGDGRNVDKLQGYADKAIYYNEMCYGETPRVPTIKSKVKPCWKDFVEIMTRAHGVTLSSDQKSLVFNKKSIGVSNTYMNNNYKYRRTMGNANQLGQGWGGQKTVSQAMYERPHFPYWQFLGNSRSLYQGARLIKSGKPDPNLALTEAECAAYARSMDAKYRASSWSGDPPKCFRCTPGSCRMRGEAGYVFYNRGGANNNCGANTYDCVQKVGKNMPAKGKWKDFVKRIVKLPGIKNPNANAIYMDEWTAWTRLMKDYKINPKSNAHQPVNGKCASCDLVPCGQCQAGCSSSACPTGTRNACANANRGKRPRFCIVPPSNVLTRQHWEKPDFPYWAFMRVLARLEKG